MKANFIILLLYCLRRIVIITSEKRHISLLLSVISISQTLSPAIEASSELSVFGYV